MICIPKISIIGDVDEEYMDDAVCYRYRVDGEERQHWFSYGKDKTKGEVSMALHKERVAMINAVESYWLTKDVQ